MRLPTNLFGLQTKHKLDVRIIIVCLLQLTNQLPDSHHKWWKGWGYGTAIPPNFKGTTQDLQ